MNNFINLVSACYNNFNLFGITPSEAHTIKQEMLVKFIKLLEEDNDCLHRIPPPRPRRILQYGDGSYETITPPSNPASFDMVDIYHSCECYPFLRYALEHKYLDPNVVNSENNSIITYTCHSDDALILVLNGANIYDKDGHILFNYIAELERFSEITNYKNDIRYYYLAKLHMKAWKIQRCYKGFKIHLEKHKKKFEPTLAAIKYAPGGGYYNDVEKSFTEFKLNTKIEIK